MKKIIIIFLIAFLMLSSFSFAAGDNVDFHVKADSDSAKIGHAITFTVEFNIPYEQEYDGAYIKISTDGLKEMKLTSVSALVCDDMSCNMVNDTGNIDFSGNKIELGAGWSGSLTLEAEAKNVEKIKASFTLHAGSEQKSVKVEAKVVDYKPTSTPTPKPTQKPKSTQEPTHKPKSTAKPTYKPGDDADTPKTGSAPENGASCVMIAAAVLCMVGACVGKRRE